MNAVSIGLKLFVYTCNVQTKHDMLYNTDRSPWNSQQQDPSGFLWSAIDRLRRACPQISHYHVGRCVLWRRTGVRDLSRNLINCDARDSSWHVPSLDKSPSSDGMLPAKLLP
jgi:hypothetical protein